MRKSIVFAILVALLASGCISTTATRNRDLAATKTASELQQKWENDYKITPTKQPAKPQKSLLFNPTFDEMIRFINHNHVNWSAYRNGNYVCVDFACDVCRAAKRQGMRCAVVLLEFPGKMGHAIIAFDTTDKGLIYFEPQADARMKVEIGRKYWSWIAEPGYSVGYDDTVVDITLVWNDKPQYDMLCK